MTADELGLLFKEQTEELKNRAAERQKREGDIIGYIFGAIAVILAVGGTIFFTQITTIEVDWFEPAPKQTIMVEGHLYYRERNYVNRSWTKKDLLIHSPDCPNPEHTKL